MKISVLGYNSQYVKLQIGCSVMSVRVGDVVDVCDCFNSNIIKTCTFCGRQYDKDEYNKTMSEQAPKRDCNYYGFATTTSCGLYCAWLKDTRFCNNTLDKRKVEAMKDDVAKRVAKYMELAGRTE